MDIFHQHLDKIRTQLHKAVVNYLHIKSENKKLMEMLDNANRTIESQKNTIDHLKSNDNLTKLADNLVNQSDDNKEVKKNLDVLIREVDKCINRLKE